MAKVLLLPATMMDDLSRWRLVLGGEADPQEDIDLTTEQQQVDDLLQSVYGGGGSPGLGRSAIRIKKWLEGIRLHFPKEIVQVMQADALERQGVREMLLEPELLEKIEPSMELVANLLQLQHLMPERSKAVARQLVHKLVSEIERKLRPKIQFAVHKAQRRHSKPGSPSASSIDWKKTIHRNLKHYRPEIGSLIPETWYGYKKGYRLPQVIIVADKSESMIQSMIHVAVLGSILASLKSIQTHLIFFDTEVTDLSNRTDDPVEILFSVPCGGGTDISLAMNYARQLIRDPKQCLIFLISDLYEGGNKKELLQTCGQLVREQVRMYGLLALNDEGTPDFDGSMAKSLAALDISCFACTPNRFPELLSDYLNQE